MRDHKKLEVLLKVIQRGYDKNAGMQEVIDTSIIEVCAEKAYLLNRYFLFCFFFAVVFIITATQEKNLSKSIEK